MKAKKCYNTLMLIAAFVHWWYGPGLRDSARRLSTRDAMLFYHTGMIERALGNTRRASYFLAQALEINPQFHPTQPAEARAVLDSIEREGPH